MAAQLLSLQSKMVAIQLEKDHGLSGTVLHWMNAIWAQIYT